MCARAAWACALLFLCAADAVAQGYGGPSVLSRGGNRPGRRGRAPVDFSFYAGVRGIYENGLLAPRLSDEGTLEPVSGYGWGAEVGLFGGHDWRRNSLGVDYRADYRNLNTRQNFNGTNHAIALEFQRRMTRRTQLSLRQTGGTTNRAFGGFAAPAFAEINRLGVPLNEVFDVRTYYSQTSVGLAYRKSARTQLFGQGDAFFIKRQNASLINSQGLVAAGGIEYRLNRRDTVSAMYNFMRIEFPRVYAGSDVQSAAFRFRRVFSESWIGDAAGGVFRVDSYATEQVKLSPEVAFVLGRSTGVAAIERVRYTPMIDAGLTYVQERGRFNVGFTSGVGAGNGIYLTTTRHTVRAGYSYAGTRRMSLGASAGYSRVSSAAITLRNLETYQFGGGMSYRLLESLNFHSQADRRTFNAPGVTGRDGYSITIGLNYSPGRFPIPIW